MSTEKLKNSIHSIIFEAESVPGKVFDIALLWCIILSVIAVILESIHTIEVNFSAFLRTLEWIFTIIFTVEYLLRIYCVHKPKKYIFSFFGFVDFFAILPSYLSIIFPGAQSLLVIRAIRLIRVFRVLKLGHYLRESRVLGYALLASRPKIIVFLTISSTIVLIFGTAMYLIEGQRPGFENIPKSLYWAVVTMTTVGYGDVTPQTPLGQLISSILMFSGYAIIAIPTGIVSVELAQAMRKNPTTMTCQNCSKEGHDPDAFYCKYCGHALKEEPSKNFE